MDHLIKLLGNSFGCVEASSYKRDGKKYLHFEKQVTNIYTDAKFFSSCDIRVSDDQIDELSRRIVDLIDGSNLSVEFSFDQSEFKFTLVSNIGGGLGLVMDACRRESLYEALQSLLNKVSEALESEK